MVVAQEICDNGIDDDNDSFIDLNDDECNCDQTISLTNVSGSICRNNLKLTIENSEATSFQWYMDGIAIIGETSEELSLREREAQTNLPIDVEGVYTCYLSGPFGCYVTEAYDLTIPSYDVYLGEETICKGDTVFFGPWAITVPGFVQYDTKASDGCDSLVSLDVVVVEPLIFNINEVTCEGSTYQFAGQEITTPGQYSHTFQNSEGCDSIVRLNLSFEPIQPVVMSASICKGDTYIFKDVIATTGGEYIATSTDANGCDSTFVINLSVLESGVTDVPMNICAGGIVEYEGKVYDAPGIYEVNLITDFGCDSMVNLTIVQDDLESFTFSREICQGKVFDNGYISESEEGTYQYISDLGECDSLIVVELSVVLDVITEEVTMCEGDPPFEFMDIKENETGIYSTLVKENGECDVLYEFDLTVLNASTSSETRSLCEGEEIIVDGVPISIGGSYEYIIPNTVGCDSTIMVHVVEFSPQAVNLEGEICPGDSYTFDGESLTEEGTYTANLQTEAGCDSIVILDLSYTTEIQVAYSRTICEGDVVTLHDIIAEEEGNYTTMVSMPSGCDSLVSLDLKVTPRTYADLSYTLCPGDTYLIHDLVATEPGNYVTKTINAAGCDSIINVQVVMAPMDTTYVAAEICEGETYIYDGKEYTDQNTIEASHLSRYGCDSTVFVDLKINPLEREELNFVMCPGEIFDYADIVTSESGTFQTRVANENGCDSLLTINVEYEDLTGEFLMEEDLQIDLGASVDIEPLYVGDQFQIYEWLDEEGTLIGTEEGLYDFAPQEDTHVDLVITNENGCSLTQRIAIEVDDEVDIYIPNVFRPLHVEEQYSSISADESVVGIKEIAIYDRWGELIYVGHHDGDIHDYIGWDGTYKGTKVMNGVYTYMVVFEIIDGSERKKAGSITVI